MSDLTRSLVQGGGVLALVILLMVFRPYMKERTRVWKLYVSTFNKVRL